MERFGGVGRGVGFGVDGKHVQRAGRPIRLQIDAGGQPVAEQERQHIIAVLPFFGGRVDFQAIAETEQTLRPRPLPDQRVEG